MALDGERADLQTLRDVVRSPSVRERTQDLTLPHREGREPLGLRMLGSRAPQPVDESRQILGRQDELSRRGSLEDGDEGSVALGGSIPQAPAASATVSTFGSVSRVAARTRTP